jgi:hypothetical protein
MRKNRQNYLRNVNVDKSAGDQLPFLGCRGLQDRTLERGPAVKVSLQLTASELDKIEPPIDPVSAMRSIALASPLLENLVQADTAAVDNA